MTTELDNAEQAELARFIEHKDRFFALIGHCVTRYQSIEDSLPGVFAAALGGDPARAHAVFAVVRGLEAKLNLISAALTGQDGMPADYCLHYSTASPPLPKRAIRSHTRPLCHSEPPA